MWDAAHRARRCQYEVRDAWLVHRSDDLRARAFLTMRFVQHSAKSEWGLGVVAGEDSSNVDVVFDGIGRKRLKKSPERLVEIDEASVPAEHPLRRLEEWPKIERDGQRAQAKRALPVRFDAFVKTFLETYPHGLRSKECDDQERTYKVDASTYARTELSPELVVALLESGDFTEIVRRARRILGKVNLAFPNELMKFRDLPPSAHREVAESIERLVTAGERTPAALENLATVLKPHGAAKWTIVSLLPFLLHPKRWPFVKPTFVMRAAEATGIDVEYEPRPNARTYELVLDLYEHVKSLLYGLGRADFIPRDFIDVQTFLWVASGMKKEVKESPEEVSMHDGV